MFVFVRIAANGPVLIKLGPSGSVEQTAFAKFLLSNYGNNRTKNIALITHFNMLILPR